eukprot:scaffold8194_cov118-Cylindrotheca_fusiformis.AAC.2
MNKLRIEVATSQIQYMIVEWRICDGYYWLASFAVLGVELVDWGTSQGFKVSMTQDLRARMFVRREVDRNA